MLYPEYFAKFYDTIYSKIRDGVDNNYFLDEIKNTKGAVLEIGVGTGRFFKDAIKVKDNLYGIDISPAMVEVLKNRVSEKYHNHISVQNIVDFKINQKFDLIIAPFRVFMHLLSTTEQLQALNNVASHLNSGGRFIFDVFIPNLKMLANGLDRVIDFEGDYAPGKKLIRRSSMYTNLAEQLNHVTMEFTWETDTGEKQQTWELDMRYFFRFEMEYLIEKSDLNLEALYGDYNKNALVADSKEMVMVCVKP